MKDRWTHEVMNSPSSQTFSVTVNPLSSWLTFQCLQAMLSAGVEYYWVFPRPLPNLTLAHVKDPVGFLSASNPQVMQSASRRLSSQTFKFSPAPGARFHMRDFEWKGQDSVKLNTQGCFVFFLNRNCATDTWTQKSMVCEIFELLCHKEK